MDQEQYYQVFLKYCPECGGILERHPSEVIYSCFLHGDFRIVKDVIVWDYTKHIINRR